MKIVKKILLTFIISTVVFLMIGKNSIVKAEEVWYKYMNIKEPMIYVGNDKNTGNNSILATLNVITEYTDGYKLNNKEDFYGYYKKILEQGAKSVDGAFYYKEEVSNQNEFIENYYLKRKNKKNKTMEGMKLEIYYDNNTNKNRTKYVLKVFDDSNKKYFTNLSELEEYIKGNDYNEKNDILFFDTGKEITKFTDDFLKDLKMGNVIIVDNEENISTYVKINGREKKYYYNDKYKQITEFSFNFSSVKLLKSEIKRDNNNIYTSNDTYTINEKPLDNSVKEWIFFTRKKDIQDNLIVVEDINELQEKVPNYKQSYNDNDFKFMYNNDTVFIHKDIIKGILRNNLVPLKDYDELETGLKENGYNYDAIFVVGNSSTPIPRSEVYNLYKNKPMTLDEVIEGGNRFLQSANEEIAAVNKEGLQQTSARIFNILITLGMALSVVIAGILGIKFVISSAEEKAQVKEQIMPYIVGCFVIGTAYGIWKLAISILKLI